MGLFLSVKKSRVLTRIRKELSPDVGDPAGILRRSLENAARGLRPDLFGALWDARLKDGATGEAIRHLHVR